MDNKPKLYDMSSKYHFSLNLSLASLCREIVEECYDETQIIIAESIRERFKNDKKTGLINRLLKKLDFDIEEVAKVSHKEKFDELRLLKLLYLIEHKGFVFEGKEYPKITIVDLLAKPRLENVDTLFSPYNHYGNAFAYLYKTIKPYVENSNTWYLLLEHVFHDWALFCKELSERFTSDDALFRLDECKIILDSIADFIDKEVFALLDKYNKSTHRNGFGVFNTFYTILICHFYRCNVEDQILNNPLLPNITPDSDYISKFKKYDNVKVTWNIIDDAKTILRGKESHNNLAYTFLELVFYENPNYKVQNCLYALDHARAYWDWIKRLKTDAKDDNLIMGILVSIVQELMFVRETKPQIINNFYRHENANKSLLRLFSCEKEENAIGVQILIKRLENRVSINTGGIELITRIRKIEQKIYEIENRLFSYTNADEIRLFHKKIFCHFEEMIEK